MLRISMGADGRRTVEWRARGTLVPFSFCWREGQPSRKRAQSDERGASSFRLQLFGWFEISG